MKIAITSKGVDLDSEIDERFGRAAYILIVDTDTMQYEVMDNSDNINAAQGAGIQAASNVSGKGARALLTGFCGPKAMTAFAGAGIQVYTGQAGTIRQAVDAFKQGTLRPASTPNVGEKFGMNATTGQPGRMTQFGGGGRGMGGGRRCLGGSGRGMGMGRGYGNSGVVNQAPSISPGEETVEELKERAVQLQRQLEDIQKKIDNM